MVAITLSVSHLKVKKNFVPATDSLCFFSDCSRIVDCTITVIIFSKSSIFKIHLKLTSDFTSLCINRERVVVIIWIKGQIIPFATASRLKVPRLSPLKNSLNVELNRDVSTVTTVPSKLQIGWIRFCTSNSSTSSFLQETLLNRMRFDLSGISCF